MTNLETALRGYVGLLADHGLLFARLLRDCAVYRSGATLPVGLSRGEPRQCYANAGRLALDRPDWTYCEGFAIGPTAPLAVHHAWCLTAAGDVVDVTWESPQACQYQGVAFDRAFCHTHWGVGRTWDIWAEHPSISVTDLPNLRPALDTRWNQRLEMAELISAHLPRKVLDQA